MSHKITRDFVSQNPNTARQNLLELSVVCALNLTRRLVALRRHLMVIASSTWRKKKTTQNTKFELDKCASRLEGVTLQDTGV